MSLLLLGDPNRAPELPPDAVVHAATSARFDNRTDTWTVTTDDGRDLTARVLVDTTPGDNDIVAVHGVPNHFRIPGPRTGRQARYVAGLLDRFHRSGATRIEARSTVRVHRLLPTRGMARFHLTGSVGDDDLYDGAAVVTHNGHEQPARVRLAGCLQPIDGRYHWQGMLYADITGDRVTGSQVSIRIGEHTACARISEQTPWGTFAVIGEPGYPPFALSDATI